MSPLRAFPGRGSGKKLPIFANRPEPAKATRVARLSAAAAMILGMGTASALFVDYLADRARSSVALDVAPLVTAAIDSAAEVASPITEAQAAPGPNEITALAGAGTPVSDPVPLQPMPIEAVLPDAAAIARLAVDPARTAELASDDALVTAYGGDDPDAAETSAATAIQQVAPASKTRKAKAADADAAASNEETEVASLPGVDVGGMAGYPSGDGDNAAGTVRTATRTQAKAASIGGVAGTARIRQSVNMRSGPKKGAGVLGVVPAGSSVSVLSCDGWCQISYEGRTGWVYKSFLSATAPKKQASVEPRKVSRASQSSRL